MLKKILLKLGMKKIAIICGVLAVTVAGSAIGIHQALNVKEADESLAVEDELDKEEIDEAEGEEADNEELSDETETSEEANAETNEVEENSEATTTTTNNASATNSNNSSTANKTTSGSTSGNTMTSPSTTTPNTTSNTNSSTTTTSQTYETFTEEIGVYTTKNLPSENPYSEFDCPAWIGVYSVGKSDAVSNQIKVKFREAFGFDATAEVACTYIGKYNVAGYSMAQDIYQYTIKDLTYSLLVDEFYVIKKKICDDGSPWVGFATPDPYDYDLLQQLLKEKMKVFCEWTGYTEQEVYYETDKFFALGLSDAGWMRTTDGQVVKVLYRYTRGINIPISKE